MILRFKKEYNVKIIYKKYKGEFEISNVTPREIELIE